MQRMSHRDQGGQPDYRPMLSSWVLREDSAPGGGTKSLPAAMEHLSRGLPSHGELGGARLRHRWWQRGLRVRGSQRG